MKHQHRKTAQQAILDAAAEIFSHNPGASLQEIADRAGVGRATLYRYFPTREKLMRDLALEALRQTDAVTAPIREQDTIAKAALEAVVTAVVPLGDRFRFLSSEWAVGQDPEVASIYARQLRELADTVERAKAEGAIAPDVPTRWVVSAIDMLIYAAWMSVQSGETTQRDAIALTLRTLFKGLAP